MSPYRSNAVLQLLLEHLQSTVDDFIHATKRDRCWSPPHYQAVIDDLGRVRDYAAELDVPPPMTCPACGNSERMGGPGHAFVYTGLTLGNHTAAHCTRCGTIWSAYLTNMTEAGQQLKLDRIRRGDDK